jgi:hypothetical protein
MSQQVRPEVAGPMTRLRETPDFSLPDFALLKAATTVHDLSMLGPCRDAEPVAVVPFRSNFHTP